MLSFVLLLIGFVFYYLSYKSPRTDFILYGISGIFFILAAIAGFAGYGDIETSHMISYTYTTVNNTTVIATETYLPIYSEHIILNKGVPIIEILVGLYILSVLGIETRQDEPRREKQSGNKS